MAKGLIVSELEKNGRERVRVTLDEYGGHDLIDLRVVVPIGEGLGLWTPTKKGLSLRIETLPALREALACAEAKALELGLLTAVQS